VCAADQENPSQVAWAHLKAWGCWRRNMAKKTKADEPKVLNVQNFCAKSLPAIQSLNRLISALKRDEPPEVTEEAREELTEVISMFTRKLARFNELLGNDVAGDSA